MPNPIERLISPLGCLISHIVIFIFSCIILVMWFSGTVVNPWSPVLSYLCASTFCLIIAIKQYQRASDIKEAQEEAQAAENDAADDEEGTTGGYETLGGDPSTTGYQYQPPVKPKASNINVTQTPSYMPASQQTVSAPELKDWSGRKTSFQPTITQLATEKPDIKPATSPADIKARMSPSYQQANDMSDMGPDVNFFPKN